jgi:lipoate-protein ligase A
MREARWRFIDAGPRPGAANMAADEAMLEALLRDEVLPTLRVYTWRPPAISLGRFQQAEGSVDLAACRRLGVEVVRRPTGGRAILHTDQEVTFSIVISESRLGVRGVMDCYRAVAGGIVAGLRGLGLDARLVERSAPVAAPPMAQDPACFAVKARCDLVVGSAKLVGSAQVQRHGALLQQNSLPLAMQVERWREVFRRTGDAPAAMGLWEAAGREVPYAEVARALRQGFGSAFGVTFEEGELTEAERARAEELTPERSLVSVRPKEKRPGLRA